jgi:hypothetical protein
MCVCVEYICLMARSCYLTTLHSRRNWNPATLPVRCRKEVYPSIEFYVPGLSSIVGMCVCGLYQYVYMYVIYALYIYIYIYIYVCVTVKSAAGLDDLLDRGT